MKEQEQTKVKHETLRYKHLRYGYKYDANFHLEASSSKARISYQQDS